MNSQFSFKYLFEALGIVNVVTLFGCVLNENRFIGRFFFADMMRVLFVSNQYTLLTVACETVVSLLYPFYWHHVYIPILPVTLIDFLQAPTPFIMGMHSSYFDSKPSTIGEVNLLRTFLNLPCSFFLSI